jgi:hypothetical protein
MILILGLTLILGGYKKIHILDIEINIKIGTRPILLQALTKLTLI